MFLWIGIAVYGFGFAGTMVIQEVVWADYFGRLSLGKVRSMGFFITFGIGASGPVVMNIVFDILGSYRPAFMVIIGIFSLSALLIGTSKPAKARRYLPVPEKGNQNYIKKSYHIKAASEGK